MAGKPWGGPPRDDGSAMAGELAACLEEARAGRPQGVYLLDGDAFLSLRAARELCHALVPEPLRALNLVELDAAASPAEVAAEVETRGLFSTGRKVVLVQEPAFLTSKEDVEEAFQKARESWAEGRQRDAARRLLALVAKAGFQAADLVPEPLRATQALLDVPAAGGPAGKAAERARKEADKARKEADKALQALARELRAEFGFTLDEAALGFVVAAGRYALERELKVAKDDSAALDAALGRGLPPGHVLVVAAGKIDATLPLVKKLAAAGRRLKVAVAREANFGAKVILAPTVRLLLEGTGKSADAEAVERLAEAVEGDARTLAQELQKLVAFVGERKVITAEDVVEVVVRTAEDQFFALGNAVEERRLPEALGVVDRSLGAGGSPHMLVASLASTVRRLLLEKERARAVVGERKLGSPRDWEAQIFPTIPAAEVGKKKPFGFWMKYQASTRFSRAELLSGLVALHEADVSMKSGQDGRLALERALLGLLAPHPSTRSTP
jgi:DNA polymerase-3 subunit delta